MDMDSKFWKRLVIAFESGGLGTKQVEMAKVLGIAQPSVFQWKAGRNYPSHDMLVKIAKLTNVSVEWLYSGRGPMRPQDLISPEKANLIDRVEGLSPEKRRIAIQILAALNDESRQHH